MTSRIWWRRRCRRMCSMIGRPATGTSGFGCRLVRGRRREPSPPAMTTAFMSPPPYRIPSYADAGRTQSFRPRPALDLAAPHRRAVSIAEPRALGIHPAESGPYARPARRAGGRRCAQARRGETGARGRPGRLSRVLRPPPAVHGRARAHGHRVLLARVRPGRVPANLLRRPRRPRRRPSEGHQRPGLAARRGGPLLQAGLRAPGDRRRRPPGRGVFREPRRGAPGAQGRRGRGGRTDRRPQGKDRRVASANRARAAFPADTDLESNPPDLRAITDRLYVPEPDRRLRQEIVLGVGGVRALRALGMVAGVFHLNEGHSFLCAIERIRELRISRQMTLEEARLVARAGIVFTTHTPIAAGSDYFEPGLVWDLLNPYLNEVGISFDRFMDLGRQRPGDPRDRLVTTYAALRLADQAVGVSRLHGAVSRRLWKDAWRGLPESQVPIGSVTNGVHMPTWVAPEIAELLRRYVGPDWWDLDGEDGRWQAVFEIPAAELWAVHLELKRNLLKVARSRSVDTEPMDEQALTFGFARRFAPYKRANLLLEDRARLNRLLRNGKRPVQLIFAGKSHPSDQPGKDIVARVVALAREEPCVVFLKDYDLAIARHLVHGADVWLNNPRRFLEASGTSGMKAGANGVLNVSVLDGWWDEAYRPELGWAIPSGATLDRQNVDDQAEAEGLYRLL